MTNETCPCKWCAKPTPMLGTKECDNCHELATRIERDPALARRILDTVAPVAERDLVRGLTASLRARMKA